MFCLADIINLRGMNRFCECLLLPSFNLTNKNDFYCSYFELEYQEACYYDSLCVYGIKFCGSWLSGRTHRYIVQANSIFTILFKSDDIVAYHGFEVNYVQGKK